MKLEFMPPAAVVTILLQPVGGITDQSADAYLDFHNNQQVRRAARMG
jgi:hypothetical protein